MPKRRPSKLRLSPGQVAILSSTFNLDPKEVQESARTISEWDGSEEALRAVLAQQYHWNADVATSHLGALWLAVQRSSRASELLPPAGSEHSA